MNFFTILISFISLFSGQALAHTDHVLGEGYIHAFYHATFLTLFVLVIYKGYRWFKHKNTTKN